MMKIFREFMLLTKYNCFRRTMARHHPDLIFCRKTTGIQIGRLCAKCDGRCVICDSYARLKNMCLRVWVNYSSCVKLFTFHSVLHFFPVFNLFYVRPTTLARICDECNYGSYQGRCVICGNPGVSDAHYCAECTILEKDRDGCPKIVNLGSAKTDLFYERKKYGFKNRSGIAKGDTHN